MPSRDSTPMGRPGSQSPDPLLPDFSLADEVDRLHHWSMKTRWQSLALLWLVVLPLAVWVLRDEITLWRAYFTWTAVRYGLVYHPLVATGLIFCISLTVSTLLWQSYVMLLGIPTRHRQRLGQRVLKIRQQGPTHPLWRQVCGGRSPQSVPTPPTTSAQHPRQD